jgi:hypothetical protein
VRVTSHNINAIVYIRSVIIKVDKTTTICVSRRNHDLLMQLGRKGESFDSILTQIIEKIKPLQESSICKELSYLPVTGESTQSDSQEGPQKAGA